MNTFTRFSQSLVIAFLSILVFFSNANAQTGNITGTVRNCVTNAPIVGASVFCVTGPVLTNAAGQYNLNGVPIGNQTATATDVGFITSSVPCTIINNQTTIVNFCMYPLGGTLTGVITDCSTGNPVAGAKVVWSNYTTYSGTNGVYTLPVYSYGTFALQVSKQGFAIFNQNVSFQT